MSGLTQNLYMQVVLHNKIGRPLYIEVPIPPELLDAIRASKITRAEFLFHEKTTSGIVTPVHPTIKPARVVKSELSNFKKDI